MDTYLVLLIIALVFLPGILWANIDAKFRPEPEPNFSFFIANSFVFGVMAYLIASIPIGFILLAVVYFVRDFLHDLFIILNKYNFIFIISLIIFSLFAIIFTLAITPFLAKKWLKIRRGRILEYYSPPNEISRGNVDIWKYVFESDISEYNVSSRLRKQTIL